MLASGESVGMCVLPSLGPAAHTLQSGQAAFQETRLWACMTTGGRCGIWKGERLGLNPQAGTCVVEALLAAVASVAPWTGWLLLS